MCLMILWPPASQYRVCNPRTGSPSGLTYASRLATGPLVARCAGHTGTRGRPRRLQVSLYLQPEVSPSAGRCRDIHGAALFIPMCNNDERVLAPPSRLPKKKLPFTLFFFLEGLGKRGWHSVDAGIAENASQCCCAMMLESECGNVMGDNQLTLTFTALPAPPT
ncbi:hypothetical protein BX600DRAFT_206725 [Xylariales sp. PMI_506]|nr:hypothetical protein BX600DRAFT_206725 [Xylariales sp. PMI_506]